ncbi:uncharacterized protein EV422DRAFT_516693 [Fimicolochytrium jonesii]|uniref:uncharacterized protein n=1 Tax=Fimicolochytrium jonesii TaxID=1396493 RepID=UPI0022FEA958|nr:uncharacterized protein EV422DRAFT_516693 [Fimicolochytrium jonesii]KAI8824897.1 hypothetical protein EV422DRAFT_516693 [Fimicolochytrium jonesii]
MDRTRGSPTAGQGDATLRQQLEEALRQLRERDEHIEQKDNDLVMAAELGSSLLEDNERLKADCTRLAAELEELAAAQRGMSLNHHPPPTPSQHFVRHPHQQSGNFTPSPTGVAILDAKRRAEEAESSAISRIGELEATISELQAQLERLRQDVRHSQEAERAAERKAALAETELAVATRELNGALTKCQEIDEDRRKVLKEKTEIMKKLKEAADREKDLEELAELRHHNRALEDAVVQITQARAEMESEVAAATHETDALARKCEELEAMIEDYRTDSERHLARNDELVWELESERDRLSKLEARLAILEPKKEGGVEDEGDRTLFSEVEDRRQALEDRHVNLTQKHAGLVKAHSMTVHQQERMRNHISRLTQLTNAREGELRISLLEEALGQAESEKQELQVKIALLEKSRSDYAGLDNRGGMIGARNAPQGTQVDNEIELECLRLRVGQLAAEQEETTRELRTLRLLKSYETEKLRSAEALLREREEELVRLKSSNSQIKFDLDEAKAWMKRFRALGPDAAAASRRESTGSSGVAVTEETRTVLVQSQSGHPKPVSSTAPVEASNPRITPSQLPSRVTKSKAATNENVTPDAGHARMDSKPAPDSYASISDITVLADSTNTPATSLATEDSNKHRAAQKARIASRASSGQGEARGPAHVYAGRIQTNPAGECNQQ